MNISIEFANSENQDLLIHKVSSWLHRDCIEKGKHEDIFWHNKNIIDTGFTENRGLVAFNNGKQVLAYMVWAPYHTCTADIIMAEVKESYRKQGVFRSMLLAFCEKYPALCMIFAKVPSQSEIVFTHLGWSKHRKAHGSTYFYKIINPPSYVENLPEGLAIGIPEQINANYFSVRRNPNLYKMRYFQIHCDRNRMLRNPIVTPFHPYAYLGIFFNKKLIAEGKIASLFRNLVHFSSLNFLVLDKIDLCKPELFAEIFQDEEEQVSSYFKNDAMDVTEESDCQESLPKKRRTHAFFQVLNEREEPRESTDAEEMSMAL